jgi:hypothetical protein
MNRYEVTYQDETVKGYWADSSGEIRNFHANDHGGIASIVCVENNSPYHN